LFFNRLFHFFGGVLRGAPGVPSFEDEASGGQVENEKKEILLIL
jgi:hypothetical protein